MRIIKGYNELEYRLRKEMERGRLLDASKIERAVGKTRLLNEIAKETGAYIIVPFPHMADSMNKNFNTDRFVAFMNMYKWRGISRNNKYLLEEGFRLKEEKYLRECCNVIGGYSR